MDLAAWDVILSRGKYFSLGHTIKFHGFLGLNWPLCENDNQLP
jgi:hypothetical protein